MKTYGFVISIVLLAVAATSIAVAGTKSNKDKRDQSFAAIAAAKEDLEKKSQQWAKTSRSVSEIQNEITFLTQRLRQGTFSDDHVKTTRQRISVLEEKLVTAKAQHKISQTESMAARERLKAAELMVTAKDRQKKAKEDEREYRREARDQRSRRGLLR